MNSTMTPLESDGPANDGDAQAVIDIALTAGTPKPLDPDDGRFAVVTIPPGGSAMIVDTTGLGESRDAHPLRASGESDAHDATTLAAFIVKYGDTNTEVWASERDRRIVAILNAGYALDEPDGFRPGWADHRITYAATRTPSWKAWVDQDGKMLEQREFAELIEDRLSDIVDPASLDMLEVAQSIEGTIGATFKSSQRLRTGERKLTYDENIQTQAGGGGELEVPEKFTIRLAPYEGADIVDVDCRLRVRIAGGTLKLGYRIIDREQVERDAFRSVVAALNHELANGDDVTRQYRPVLMGSPAGPTEPRR